MSPRVLPYAYFEGHSRWGSLSMSIHTNLDHMSYTEKLTKDMVELKSVNIFNLSYQTGLMALRTGKA